MKKILVALFVAAFASSASAAIAGSPHDLSASGTIGSCQYCHAPHLWATSSMGDNIPLWNKDYTAPDYTEYNSNNINGATLTVGNGSKICLVCHDGTANMGTQVNGTDVNVGTLAAANYGFVGTDLSNDHPVGIVYNTANDLRTATAGMVNNMKLFLVSGTNYSVECASCHDPHGTWDDTRGGNAFLRGPAATFDQCTACHSK